MPQTTIVISYDSEFNVTESNFGSIEDSAEQHRMVSYALAFFNHPITRYKKKRVKCSNHPNRITIIIKDGKIQVIYGDSNMLNNFLVLTKFDINFGTHKS